MKKRRRFRFDIRIAVTLFLVSVLVLSGVYMIVTGIKEMNESKRDAEGYEVVQGYFYDYIIEDEGGYDAVKNKHSSATYKLVYTYNVHGIDYTVTTDYSTSIVPPQGSEKNIHYNPENPKEAYIEGANSYVKMIALGLFFSVVPLLIISAIVIPIKVKTKFEITGMIFGFTAAAVGYGAIGIMADTFSPSAILKYIFTSFTFLLLIPLAMIAAGVFLFIKSLFVRNTETDEEEKEDEYTEDEYGEAEEAADYESEYESPYFYGGRTGRPSLNKSDNEPKRKENPKALIAAALVIILAVVLSVGIYFVRTAQYNDYVSAPGVITQIDIRQGSGKSSGNHTIYFTYTVDETEYSGASSYSGSSTDRIEGETVEVWYDPDNPGESSFHKPVPGLDPIVPLFFCIPVAGVVYRIVSGRKTYGY